MFVLSLKHKQKVWENFEFDSSVQMKKMQMKSRGGGGGLGGGAKRLEHKFTFGLLGTFPSSYNDTTLVKNRRELS